MLTIRPTKILARRLGIELPKAPPVVTNRVADWCAHEFRVARYRYLIFCNTASLYPVVMMATGVTDGRNSPRDCWAGCKPVYAVRRWRPNSSAELSSKGRSSNGPRSPEGPFSAA